MIQELGRYEISAELGQGAMGTVYKARDPLLDRTVAIKTISLNLPKDEVAEYEARFYQEAKAAGQLSHPNIVTIYDIGKCDDLAYMAMEYLEGQELRKLLGASVPIPIENALSIGAQVADALNYAHEREIVHRDVKPANVMVLNDGQVKITDFGIARMRTNEVKTMTGMILGSPKYMSPEQVAGKRADQRSDIFSLGVVVYEMLTGTSPFVADNIHGVMYQTLNFNPPAPRVLNPDLPEVLNFIVAKALAKNLDDRYRTASDFAGDLRRARAEFLGGGIDSPLIASRPGEIQPFVEPPAPLTRQDDRRTVAMGNDGHHENQNADSERDPGASTEEQSGPRLGISEVFDSFDATMRLAALTGVEPSDANLSETQEIERLKAIVSEKRSGQPPSLSASATWRNSAAVDQFSTPRNNKSDNTLRNIWIGSAVLLLAAIVIFVFG